MIIGITGRAGAGKDTVADILKRTYPVATWAFAFPIKRMLNTILDVSIDAWKDREWKEAVLPSIGYSPRKLAQTLGTEWGREALDENFWVRIAMAEAENFRFDYPTWDLAITDCRFENEADAIRARGGVIWHVVRPGDADATKSEHSSEAGVKIRLEFDMVIVNNAGLPELEQAVFKAYEKLQLRKKANAAI